MLLRFISLLLVLVVPDGASGQVLRQPVTESAEQSATSPPLVLRQAGNPEADAGAESQVLVADVVVRLREQMREIAESSVSAAEKQAQLDQLVTDHPLVFSNNEDPLNTRPRTVEDAVEMLEEMIYQEAIRVAPTEQSRSQVISNMPAYIDELEPNRPLLIAPPGERSKIVITREAEARAVEGYTPWWISAALAAEQQAILELSESPGPPEKPQEAAAEKAEEVVAVAFLADNQVTEEMHDDTTVLRAVEDDGGDLVLFDALHLWVGGAVQLDGIYVDGLLNANAGGSRSDAEIRRGEVIVRSTLYQLGELKLQYDLDSNIWRDLYWRRVSEEKSRILTLGNQKEPMGLDYQMGNKFGTAMERSAPSTAFGSFRSMGVRFNEWFQLDPDESFFSLGADKPRFLTTTIGLFTEGLDSDEDTDLALTGRLTMGQQLGNGSAYHVGISGTLREGEFGRISPRPEIQGADRVRLANFDADRQYALGLEAMYTRGSLHAQSELTYSDYRGGESDAQGWGAYVQAGWFITGEQREYRPRWGLWAPIKKKGEHAFEVFSRFSFTSGDSDDDSRNNLGVVTVGGSWYVGRFRTSLNALYSRTRRDVNYEDNGYGMAARVQYLF